MEGEGLINSTLELWRRHHVLVMLYCVYSGTCLQYSLFRTATPLLWSLLHAGPTCLYKWPD